MRLVGVRVTASPSSKMRPPLLTNWLALAFRLPLLMTLPIRLFSAVALKMMNPPGALTADLFSTSAATWAGATVMLARRLAESKFRRIASPAASTTVPCAATVMVPALRTSGASRAM